MNYLKLTIVSLLILESLSIVIKPEKKNLLSKMKVKSTGVNLNGYPEEILKELNNFRKKEHYSPFIRWENSLASTGKQLYLNKIKLAGREASSIANKNNFGEHSNFESWKKSLNHKIFTELTLVVDTEGMMPPKHIFAKTIIEALKSEQEWYLIHPYTHAGISIQPMKKKDNFIVVLHLIKRTSKVTSCLEAKNFGLKQEQIDIYPGGKKYRVKCDQNTAGGGWTRVLDMNVVSYGGAKQAINDLGLKYTQLLFVAKSNYIMDYARGGTNDINNEWEFTGYSFCYNALQFNNVWYMGEHECGTHQGYRKKFNYKTYPLNAINVDIIERASKCLAGRNNIVAQCAKKFILKKLPEGRVNMISDLETLAAVSTENNYWKQYYEIYLR